jgi:hypothetical protein
MSATVLQTQLAELLKQARKTRPTMKAADTGKSKVGRANYERFYGSVTLRALPGERRLVLMQRTLGEDGKVLIVDSFIQATVYASFVVSIELDTLYEWVKLAPARERLELAITHTQFNVGRKQFNAPALKIVANRCSAHFKVNEQVLGENPISLLTASDTWERAASAPETPLCGDAPCPVNPVKVAPAFIRSANLDGELVILSYIIPANTALGTDRWIAHSGKGETHLKLELYKEQVGAIKLVGYDGAWFNQNKPFRCHIYVILDKQRKIKEVLPPETTDPEWKIMDGSPVPEKVKKWGVAGRKVDQTHTQAAMQRATLCMKLGLPLDASDEEINAMQETPEYAPAGYVKTVHPSELQPGDVFLFNSGCGAIEGDTFLSFVGVPENPQSGFSETWYNVLIRSWRGNVFADVLYTEDHHSKMMVYRDPAGYTLTELEQMKVKQCAKPDAPHWEMGWAEDGKGGIESKWVSQ